MHLAPLLGKVLAVMTEDDRHQEVLDEVIELASRTVNDNSELIRERIEQETPWWIPVGGRRQDLQAGACARSSGC